MFVVAVFVHSGLLNCIFPFIFPFLETSNLVIIYSEVFPISNLSKDEVACINSCKYHFKYISFILHEVPELISMMPVKPSLITALLITLTSILHRLRKTISFSFTLLVET